MQLSKSITAILLLAFTVEAAPAASPGNASVNEASPDVLFIEKRDSINDCGDSTFEGESSSASPTAADCLQIARNIAGGGTWTVSGVPGYHHQLVQHGTCAFGVEMAPGFGAGPLYKVGNQDIIDLINESVRRFQWNGLIGSTGIMPCQAVGEGDVRVQWGLYHD